MRFNLLSFLCAATVIAYLQRSALGVPSKSIESDLGIDPQAMGLVWLAWYAGYAAFQLPAGWVADRIGSKAALISFAVVWSILTAVTGAATFSGYLGSPAVHHGLAIASLVVNVVAAVIEYRAITRNGQLIDRILAEPTPANAF